MGKSFDGATIEFINWGEYNPRTDSKKPSWFRLDNTFLTGQKYFDLNSGQKLLGVLLMSLTSQANGSPITLNYSYLQTFTGLTSEQISKALEIYVDRESLRVTRARHARHSRDTRKETSSNLRDLPATDGRTDEDGRTKTDGRDSARASSRDAFDLESAYRRYPRKEGKSKGLKKLQAEIKTLQDFEQLLVAIEHYAESRRGEDQKFTKHFSTWAGEWRDWIDWKPSAHVAEPDNPAYRRQRGNAYALQQALASIGETHEQAI